MARGPVATERFIMPASSPPFSSSSRGSSASESARADLAGLVRRAQDERLRLLRMLGEARGQVAAAVPTVAPVTVAAAAAEQAERIKALKELEARIDAKLARLEKLDAAAERDGEAAVARRLAERAERHAAQLERRLMERLNAQRDAFLRDLAERVEAEREACGGRIAADFEAARGELDRVGGEVKRRSGDAVEHARRTAAEAASAVERAAGEALARADAVRAAFDERVIEGQHAQHRRMQAAVADTEARLGELAAGLDERIAALAEGFDGQARAVIAELRDRAAALVDRMAGTVASLSAFPPGEGRKAA